MKNILRAGIVFILGLFLFSTVYANDSLEEFTNNPTAANFNSLQPEDQTELNFNQLGPAEQQQFLSTSADYSNMEHARIAKNYLTNKQLTGRDIIIANEYFSHITGAANVDLYQGNVQFDGVSLINDGMILAGLEQLQAKGVVSIRSTSSGFDVSFVTQDISLTTTTPLASTPVTLSESSSGNILINLPNQEIEVISGSVEVTVSSENQLLFENIGTGQSQILIDKTIQDTTIQSVLLEPEGKLRLSTNQLKGHLEKGELFTTQTKNIQGLDYSISQSYKTTHSTTFGLESTISELENYNPAESYVIFSGVDSWANTIQENGLYGAGSAIYGTGITYAVSENYNSQKIVQTTYNAPFDSNIQGNPIFVYEGFSESEIISSKILYSPPYQFIDEDGNVIQSSDIEGLLQSSVKREEYESTLFTTFPDETTLIFRSSTEQGYTSVLEKRSDVDFQAPEYIIIEPELIRKNSIGKNTISLDAIPNLKGEVVITDKTSFDLGLFGEQEIPSQGIFSIDYKNGEEAFSCSNCKGSVDFESGTIEFSSSQEMLFTLGNKEIVLGKGSSASMQINTDDNTAVLSIEVPQATYAQITEQNEQNSIDTLATLSGAETEITFSIDPENSQTLSKIDGTYSLLSGTYVKANTKGYIREVQGSIDESSIDIGNVERGIIEFGSQEKKVNIDLSDLSDTVSYNFIDNTISSSGTSITANVYGRDLEIIPEEVIDFNSPHNFLVKGEDISGEGVIFFDGESSNNVLIVQGAVESNIAREAKKNNILAQAVITVRSIPGLLFSDFNTYKFKKEIELN